MVVAPFPTCVRDLEALCPVEAVCQAPSVDAGGFVRACASGGPGVGPNCTDSGTQAQIAVYKADGSLCYTLGFEVLISHACEAATYTWTDSSGQIVATGFSGEGFLQVGCGSDLGVNPTTVCERGVCATPVSRLSSACACATDSNPTPDSNSTPNSR